MAKCRSRSILNDESPTPEASCPAPAPATANPSPQPQPQQQPQQQQQNYLPQTSLLKIEPFVPSFNQRLRRRPIGRSHSTLSHNAIPKRPVQQQLQQQQLQQQQQQSELQVGQQQQLKRSYAAAVQIRQQQQQQQQRNLPRGVGIQRQRSKSTSSSAASNSCRPATAAVTPNTLVGSAGGTLVSGAIVTPQPNGICRIQRLPKEREELPDRINYDKRGLTAIPIFEQEPNLRLLSLQHNLINTFHIPKELPPPPPPAPPPPIATPRESNNNKLGEYNGNGKPEGGRSGLRGHHPGRLTRAMTNAGGNSHRLSPKSGGSPGSGSPLTTQALAINGGGPAGRSKLAKRGYNYGQAQLTPPPALRMRYGLEKSKSFVSSSLQAMKHQQQLIQRRAFLKATRGVAGGAASNLLQSCDEGSALHSSNLSLCGGCGEEEDSPSVMNSISALDQLSIKNKQLSLSASYGSIFQQLVFLDLYDNQIERIANLDGLPSLSVLLLGKNRITDIGGLSSLKDSLRVLDLHGNKLTSLGSRINCLQQLKSLNLAGNQIRQINQQDFLGLRCLRELNLKRNKLRRINGFQHLVALERLWLCHNELHRVDDMASIARANKLLEVTIENNPVSLAGDCVSFLVSYLPLLQSLSQMPITEQVRRAALAWRQHKEQAQAAPGSSEAYHNIRREEVISNARTNWELLRSQQTVVGRPKSRLTSELAKINESNEGPTAEEAETESEESQQPKELMDELQALIKLPPISKNVKSPQEEDGVSSEASSLGPNVDSCSSCYSSDNEEGGAKNKPLTPQIDENCNKVGLAEKPPPSPATPVSPSPDAVRVIPPAPVASSPSPPAVTLTPPAAPGTPVPGAAPTPPPAATATLPVPATASCNTSRPTSSKQRSRHAPITQLGLQINQRGGTGASSRRYMAGSLVRAQTVSSSTSNSSSSNSTGRGKATNNGLTLVATQSKAATSATSSQSSAGTGAAAGASATGAAAAGTTATPSAAITVSKPSAAEREREQGGDYLIEICGRYLNIYGQGALRFIDKQWNPAKANDVHTLNFSYINFNSIVCVLGRIKLRFPHAEHFVFRETNISCLGQLNGLAELQGLSSLLIDAEGNGITSKESWRAYAIYRLSHWGLKQLNGQEVTEAEVEAANAMYVGLSDLVLWSMPEVMLQPLLARLRLDETCTASKLSPKEWLQRPDNKSLRLVVGKEALQWKKNTGAATAASMNLNPATDAGSTAMAPSARDRGRQHFALLLENTCNAVEKLHKLETLWPSMLLDIVRNTLLDYAQLDVYLRNLMCELMK
ncbi:uncharacterized protein LOC108096399 [Drosophila ficusphila]|uniref:uncharacterized protein LOC108096399 n=1 Tax=Drosophila ficusphila TaxID=30025 RepID=UPI0007E5E9BD|nr:uncharacterized protein LOC108096399 [Drosophila ficusphila]